MSESRQSLHSTSQRCLRVAHRQVEPLLVARDAAALKAPAFAAVSDAVILQLFDLAVSCTAMPTSRRPSTLKLVAELEALWSQIAVKSGNLSEKVDSALQHVKKHSVESLQDEIDSLLDVLV